MTARRQQLLQLYFRLLYCSTSRERRRNFACNSYTAVRARHQYRLAALLW